MLGWGAKTTMVDPRVALRGRPDPLPSIPRDHAVLPVSLHAPWTTASGGRAEVLYLSFGCFWGAERIMWRQPGVVSTAVGYAGGYTPNPTYEEVCSGRTGHTETVLVAYDPAVTSAEALMKAFWENHDPTQGMRQGNDHGTQYRSAVYATDPGQADAARRAIAEYQPRLTASGYGTITTEVLPAGPFHFAERYHQQYLDKNPGGYCNHGPNGLTCQIGLLRQDGVPAQTSVEPPA